jgi:hypothetical protein
MERCGEVIGGLYDTSHFACKSDTTVVPESTQERLGFFHTMHVMHKTVRLKLKVDHSSLDIFGVYEG